MDLSGLIMVVFMVVTAGGGAGFGRAHGSDSAGLARAHGSGGGGGERAQTSGIEGRVYLLAGNRMPSPPRRPGDTARHSAEGRGVKGTVCVFELTNDSQVTRQGTSPWCEAVHTRLVRQVDTDDKGNFTIPLPPGTYSVFTKKDNLFYASRRDQQNNIAPVKVLPGEMTRVDCSVESSQKVVY